MARVEKSAKQPAAPKVRPIPKAYPNTKGSWEGLGTFRFSESGDTLVAHWILPGSNEASASFLELCTDPNLAGRRQELGTLIGEIAKRAGDHALVTIPGPKEAMAEASRLHRQAASWLHWAKVPAGHMTFPKQKAKPKTLNAVEQLHSFIANGNSGALPKKLAAQLNEWVNTSKGQHWHIDMCESIGCYIDFTSICIEIDDAFWALDRAGIMYAPESIKSLDELTTEQKTIVVESWLETRFEDPDQGGVSGYGIYCSKTEGFANIYLLIDWNPWEGNLGESDGNAIAAFESSEQAMEWLRKQGIVDVDWIEEHGQLEQVLRAMAVI